MLKKELKIEKILIMMLCIIVSLLSTVSCTKDELSFDNNQNRIDNLSDIQANIGTKPGALENFENIEYYKNFQFESENLYNKHNYYLDKISEIDKFPSVESNKYSLQELTRLLYMNSKRVQEIPEGYETNLYYDYYNEKSFVNNYDMNKKVKPYVELIFSVNRNSYSYNTLEINSPMYCYDVFNADERTQLRFHGVDKDDEYYFTRYIEKDKYCELTGIDEKIIDNLRIMTFTRLQIFDKRPDSEKNLDEADLCHYIYQFPYYDNYKDYRNESINVDRKMNLKQYIKPGSCIFVFDKTLDQLDNHYGFNFGHMMIVSDYYQETMSDQYINLDEYKRLSNNQEFVEIDALRKDMYDSSVSFEDYLKHFVFIEAYLTSQDRENNKLYFDKRKGVIFSSGNDREVQENFRNNYTVIAVSNLNKGVKMYNTEIQNSFLNYIRDAAIHNRSYDGNPTLDEDGTESYCSGLVYFGYEKNGFKILSRIQSSIHFFGAHWYMPRTITNSPFMYTRIWYRK